MLIDVKHADAAGVLETLERIRRQEARGPSGPIASLWDATADH